MNQIPFTEVFRNCSRVECMVGEKYEEKFVQSNEDES